MTTSDFAAVARDLPALIAPLHPLGQQWEPLGHFPVYQVLLPGPTKVEYLFLDQSQQAMPAPKPGPATLDAINTHFWDWIWWIATKAAIGRNDLVAEHLPQLFGRLLRPIGVTEPPADIGAAIDAFISRRDELERDYGITVSRELEEEVRAASAASARRPNNAERPAIRGEPQVRTFQCDAQLGAPLGSPPPEHRPYLVQRDATPKDGASAVSWRIAIGW